MDEVSKAVSARLFAGGAKWAIACDRSIGRKRHQAPLKLRSPLGSNVT